MGALLAALYRAAEDYNAGNAFVLCCVSGIATRTAPRNMFQKEREVLNRCEDISMVLLKSRANRGYNFDYSVPRLWFVSVPILLFCRFHNVGFPVPIFPILFLFGTRRRRRPPAGQIFQKRRD